MKTFTGIVITGASSGIGEAIALDYARPGAALALTGRDAQRLEAVAGACRAKGATVFAETIDVVERERFAAWLQAFDDAHPVDLVLANAGISIDKDNSSIDDFGVIRRTFDVNVYGTLNTVEPLLDRMIAERGATPPTEAMPVSSTMRRTSAARHLSSRCRVWPLRRYHGSLVMNPTWASSVPARPCCPTR